MNKKRMLKLANMLDENASNRKGMKFDLGTVGKSAESSYFDEVPNFKPSLDCGTVGCAMGLAAISGKFKRAGLDYEIPSGTSAVWITLNGVTEDYDTAAVKLFGISHDQAHTLFSPWTYSPKMRIGARAERCVAKRIRKMVEGKPIKERTAIF